MRYSPKYNTYIVLDDQRISTSSTYYNNWAEGSEDQNNFHEFRPQINTGYAAQQGYHTFPTGTKSFQDKYLTLVGILVRFGNEVLPRVIKSYRVAYFQISYIKAKTIRTRWNIGLRITYGDYCLSPVVTLMKYLLMY